MKCHSESSLNRIDDLNRTWIEDSLKFYLKRKFTQNRDKNEIKLNIEYKTESYLYRVRNEKSLIIKMKSRPKSSLKLQDTENRVEHEKPLKSNRKMKKRSDGYNNKQSLKFESKMKSQNQVSTEYAPIIKTLIKSWSILSRKLKTHSKSNKKWKNHS